MLRLFLHLAAVAALTALTQVGGVAWLISLRFRLRIAAFLLIYAAFTILASVAAPLLGRQPIGCGGDGPLRMQSWFYCITNRNHVTPELAKVATDLATHIATRHPGTVTLVLDGNFPFLPGFPLLPHLSHDDGRKLDFAFYYNDLHGNYLPGRTRSPLGYFAFEQGPTHCPPRRITLRWDMIWLQPLLPDYRPDRARMAAMLTWLAHDPRVARVFLEPHLVETFGIPSPKFGFQGCRAARHDDHVHIQI